MLAGSKDMSLIRISIALVLLCCVPRAGLCQSPLDAQLAELRESARYVPEKAQVTLLQLEAQARAAGVPTRAEFISQLALTYMRIGQRDKALLLANEVVALGKQQHDNVALTKGLLVQSYVRYGMADLKTSHQLAAEAEKVANSTTDLPLRVQATMSAGQAFAEDGNFPPALKKMQEAVALARTTNAPLPLLSALSALIDLYDQMKQYDKGFENLDETWALASALKSPGRMASAKITEYSLSIDTNQPVRALKAQQEALVLARQIGATNLISLCLVNLSDSYLKAHDYPNTIRYADQALAAARGRNDLDTEATAYINIGQAYMGMGRLADGKRSMEAGMAQYEKSGNKPELQSVLMEYGQALEHAGDIGGALAIYHRERTISNELFEKQRQKAVWELQEKYEADKQLRQILLLSRENQVKTAEIDNRRLQQRVWWLLAVVFALAAVIVGLLYRKVRHANAQLEVKNLELKAQSSRDPLTALYNRRHFQEFMRAHTELEQRGSGPTGEDIVGALFLLDVDHFKHVNDGYGHAAGDAVLKMIAENLREILRETDMIVRWGGEEFLAFLPAIPRSGVDDIARRILAGISSHVIDYQGNKISVNVSVGFAPYPLIPAQHPLPWERAVNLVDMALYLAKAHGRNRAYGVRGFINFEKTSMEAIEQDLERAWRAGFVDLAIVLGNQPEQPAPTEPVSSVASCPSAPLIVPAST